MKYIANPVRVDAQIILEVGPIRPDGSAHLHLQDGTHPLATKNMIARFIPSPGDYWVTQEDGYVYLNPKNVFLRKYSPIPTASW